MKKSFATTMALMAMITAFAAPMTANAAIMVDENGVVYETEPLAPASEPQLVDDGTTISDMPILYDDEESTTKTFPMYLTVEKKSVKVKKGKKATVGVTVRNWDKQRDGSEVKVTASKGIKTKLTLVGAVSSINENLEISNATNYAVKITAKKSGKVKVSIGGQTKTIKVKVAKK